MKNNLHDKLIPFYGGENPTLFEIERRCMDRNGKVITFLDSVLPHSIVLDVGAGNGFTAEKLNRQHRLVIPLEPDEKMVDHTKNLIWTKGVAQAIPFHSNTFDAMYSTWAFFFDNVPNIEDGLREVKRVVKKGGLIVIVDNYGDDELDRKS